MRGSVHNRMLVAACLMMCGFTWLSYQLMKVQWLEVDRVAGHAPNLQREVIPSKRGSILDRQGDLLAGDQQVRNVVVDPYHLSDKHYVWAGLAKAAGVKVSKIRGSGKLPELRVRYKELVANRLAMILAPMTEGEIHAAISVDSMAPILLAKNVPESVGAKLEEFLREEKIGGVYCHKEAIRFYPSRNRLVHLIGYVGEQGSDQTEEDRKLLTLTEIAEEKERIRLKGRVGVEAGYDDILSGVDGFRMVQRDVKGREVIDYRGETVDPQHGNTVRLTIDMMLQKILEDSLEEAMERFGAERVSGVMMRPHTGEVLAMANRPDYDRRTMVGNHDDYAVSAPYEPGSTMKLFTFAAAFDVGLVSPTTSIYCEGGEMFQPVHLTDVGRYGDLTVNQVIAKSSNIGTYKVAMMLGSNRLHDYFTRFGFGQKTGIAIRSESSGVLRDVADWSGTSLSRVSIGYEVAVTPLQLATALGVIANGGEYYPPMIVRSIEDDEGNLLEHFAPTPSRRVISELAAARVREAMELVISSGTGRRAATSWPVAGKTATSKKWIAYENGIGGRYVEERYVCSFAGFVPADNPEYAVSIMIDDPRYGAESIGGSTVAAPIFAKIVERAMSYRELNRELVLNEAGVANEDGAP